MPKTHHPCCSPGSDFRVDEPVWDPLLAALGEHLTCGFMYMYATRLENGTVVHAYKHHDMRTYMFLDEELQAFRYTACSGYSPTPLDWAIKDALCPWLLSQLIEPDDVAALRAALDRAQALDVDATS